MASSTEAPAAATSSTLNAWTGPPGWALQISRSTGKRYWQKGSVSWWHDSSLPAGWAWGQASSDGPRFWVELATGVRRDSPPTAVSAALLAPAKSSAPAPADVQSPPPSKRARREDNAPAAAHVPPYRYLVYPDYVPELLIAPLLRRGAIWENALAGWHVQRPGYWRAVEEAVSSNSWEFVSKPSVLFKASGTGTTGSEGFPSTLHSVPAAPSGALPQLINHMPNPRALSSGPFGYSHSFSSSYLLSPRRCHLHYLAWSCAHPYRSGIRAPWS